MRKSKIKGDETLYEAAAKLKDNDPRVSPEVDRPWTRPTSMEREGPASSVEPGQKQMDFSDEIVQEEIAQADDSDGRAGAADSGGVEAVLSAEAGSPPFADERASEAHGDDEQILAPAEFDRLVDAGVISEDGVPLSQESVEVIEQPDRAPRRPMLPAPQEYEDAS